MKNPLLKRIISVLVSLCCLVGLTGCGYKDIDKRYFVLNLGIDHHEGKEPYTVSIKVAIPSEEGQSGGSSNQSTVLSINTTSITEGIELLKTQLDKQLDFGHIKVLLVDPYVAKHNMPTIASWLIQRQDIQKIAYVAIAKPTSKKILNTKPDTEKMPSGTLLLMFGDTGAISPYINTQYLFSFYRDLYEEGKTAVLPIIETTKDNRLQVQTVGAFNQQKLVTELTPRETLFLNAFINKGHTFYINEAIDPHQNVASFKVIRTHIFLHTRAAIPYADVQVKATGDLGLPSKKVTIQNNIKMEKKVNQRMENEIKNLLVTLQKKGVDPIGMGLIYRSHHLNHWTDWKNWQAIYPTLKFKVYVHTKFKENGISG